MNRFARFFLIAATFFCGISLPVTGYSQQMLDAAFIQSMKKDMQILASDSLEGREAGSMGELYASLYIAERFENMGVKPYFGICYFQDFEFPDGKEYTSSNNYVKYNGNQGRQVQLAVGDYTPLQWGADGNISAVVFDADYCLPPFTVPAKNQRSHGKETMALPDLEGKIALVRYDAPAGYPFRDDVTRIMAEKVKYAAQLGAIGVIFYNPDGNVKVAPGQYYIQDKLPVPVVFMHDPEQALALSGNKVDFSVESSKKVSFGKNVAGWINNGAEKTVVIGAHYDHLGWGSNSSRNSGMPAIHYGADDNASGVCGMLALAEWLSRGNLSHRNYLFIAFSAEEKGLLGSRFFVENATFDSSKYLCMLNFDMIGRVKETAPQISLLAGGSSSGWKDIIPLVKEDVNAELVTEGTNGSDHYSFYSHHIPVLFFFNGIHDDYHKPSDVKEKINYNGLRDVVEYSVNLLRIVDTLQQLPFQEIVSTQQSSGRRGGKTSLGIIPDHGKDSDGVLVQDVIPEKPAMVAGIQKGDLIVKVGGNPVHDITDYMKALDQIKEGTRVKVEVLRSGKKKKFTLQF
jgi:aminopeptidase YwaD